MADLGFSFAEADNDIYDGESDYQEHQQPKDPQVDEIDQIPATTDENKDGLHYDEIDSDALLQAMADGPLEDPTSYSSTETYDHDMTALEKIFLYAKSEVVQHRSYIARELPGMLNEVDISEAIRVVLHIVAGLALDPDEIVRQSLVQGLDRIVLWYYANCPPTTSADTPSGWEVVQSSDVTSENTPESPASTNPSEEDKALASLSLSEDTITTFPSFVKNPSTVLNDSTETLQPPSELDAPPVPNIVNISPHTFPSLLAELLFDPNQAIHENVLKCIISIAQNITSVELLETEIVDGILFRLIRIAEERSSATAESPQQAEISDNEAGIAKISVMKLLCSLSQNLGKAECLRILPAVERFAKDPIFYVRQEVAACLGALGSLFGPTGNPEEDSVLENRILPLYRHFAKDNIYHVRRAIIFSLPPLCRTLGPSERLDIVTDAIKLFQNDVSDGVRRALGEILGDLIDTFSDQKHLPPLLTDYFLRLFESYFSISPMEQHQSSELFVPLSLKQRFDSPDTGPTPASQLRQVLFFSLHHLPPNLNLQTLHQTVLPILRIYITHPFNPPGEKLGLLEHFADFLAAMPSTLEQDEVMSWIKPIWEGLGSEWRLREIFLRQMPAVLDIVGVRGLTESGVVTLVKIGCEDRVDRVRVAAVECWSSILETAKTSSQIPSITREQSERLVKAVLQELDAFADATTYRGRIVYTQIVYSLLLTGISLEEFEQNFLPRLVTLSEDRVVDVRIKISRVIEVVCRSERYYPTAILPATVANLVNKLALDSSPEVASRMRRFTDVEALNRKQQESAQIEALNAATPSKSTAVEPADEVVPMDLDSNDQGTNGNLPHDIRESPSLPSRVAWTSQESSLTEEGRPALIAGAPSISV